jgi:predicted MFS family arabinose efflux permease
LIYLLRSILVTAFILLPITPVTTLIFTCSLGLLWLSTVPLTMGLVTVMFGTRYMATLYGFVFLSHQIGSFLGVWLGGRLYDSLGSYDPVWWMGVALGLFAAIVHLPIVERRAASFSAA